MLRQRQQQARTLYGERKCVAHGTAHNSTGSFSCALLTTAFPSTAPSPQACLARPSFERQEPGMSRNFVPGSVPPYRSASSTLAGGWPFARIYGYLRTAV